MNRNATLWALAFVLTVVVAYYQRVTGPTYPLSGKLILSGKVIDYRLVRSHAGNTDATISIRTPDSSVGGFVEWKRLNTRDAWSKVPMRRQDRELAAELPHQPPAGKLEYRVTLLDANEAAVIPGEGAVTIRFKGEVPTGLLIVHVLAMFLSMLLAARAGLEYFDGHSNLRRLVYATIATLLVGGFVLGPFVQKYAFDAWWTGWPFGSDLTDNKTAVALLGWLAVALAMGKAKRPKLLALAAAIVMFVVYLIPHSLLGSELDYKTLDHQNVNVDTTNVH